MKKNLDFLEKYDFNLESYNEYISKKISKDLLDDFGNLILSANIEEPNITEVEKFVLKVPAKKKKLKKTQVELFMDTHVTEFEDKEDEEGVASDSEGPVVDLADEIDNEVRSQIDQERILQTQLDEMSDILDSEIEKGVHFQEKSSENFTAAKNIIISQRISAGEGNVPSDFSNKFPFLPLGETTESETDSFPFLSE
jgi:hypothetical protein